MKPVRVLHVLGSMNRGGVETWLMHVLRHIDRKRFQLDFLVHTDSPASYDAEITALGSRIFHCPFAHDPFRYAARFLQIVRGSGPFDALHSHVHSFSGFTMSLARFAGIPVRIAHSHTDTAAADRHAGLGRRLYLRTARRLIHANATRGIAVTVPAGDALFGSGWRTNERFEVFYCSIDLAPFEEQVDPAVVRRQFGFSTQDIVFGHVGRFAPVKNQSFLIDVASQLLSLQPCAKFLFVGDGPLRASVEQRARDAGLAEKVVFAGERPDVPRLLRGAVDVCLFPSLHEGLPLVMIEMQAAGLRCLLSDVVATETVINPDLVHRLPLAAGAREWARRACALAEEPPYDRRRALEVVQLSPFAVQQRLAHLADMYLGKPAPGTSIRVQSKVTI